MVKSTAQTPEEYIAQLPDDRRQQISELRQVILKNLPSGYEESVNWGMITYQIPIKDYPDTYNKQPLPIAALASQKNYMSLYLMAVYGNPSIETWFRDEFKKSGKKLDMGKSCVRFKSIDDLPLDLIGQAVAKISPKDLIAVYEESRK